MGTFQTSDKRSANIYNMIKETFTDSDDYVRLGELLAENARDELQYGLAKLTEDSLNTLVGEIKEDIREEMAKQEQGVDFDAVKLRKLQDKYLRYFKLHQRVKADNDKYAREDQQRQAELKMKREDEERRQAQIRENQAIIDLIDGIGTESFPDETEKKY